MKFQYGLIIAMSLLVASSLALIFNQPEQIPHWKALNEIKIQKFDVVCEDCKINAQERGYICIDLEADEYVCRPAREIRFPDQEYPISSVMPPEYGEFAYFPEGKRLEDRLFDVAKIDLINPDTKQIQVEFASRHKDLPEADFTYFAMIHPGDTFVSHCTGSHLKTGHIVEYVDVIEIDGTTYIEFWGIHATMPDELLPCDLPGLIEQSLPIDLSLGIDFGLTEPPVVISLPEGIANPESRINPTPQEVTVVIGVNNTIVFSNDDDAPRTITADHGEFSTRHLKPNQTHTIVLSEPGIYDYHGEPGPWITGTIIVIEGKN